MASSGSDELNLDVLDDLLRQAEEFDQHMRADFPELYGTDAAPVRPAAPAARPVDDRFSFFTGDEEAPKPTRSALVPEPEEEDLPDIDDDSLQAYYLRRKYEHLPSDSRFEHAPAGDTISRMGDAPAQLPDEELFLYALTKLNAGVSDEALSAIALMERRPGMNPLLAFLPAYTALGNGASRSRIEGLCSARLSNAPGEAPEREMVLLSQRMLREVMDVITEAEKLQEAGYRNRQEALQKAAQNVRQRLSRLNY